MDPLGVGQLLDLCRSRPVQAAVADPADRHGEVAVERPLVEHDPPDRKAPSDGGSLLRLAEDALAASPNGPSLARTTASSTVSKTMKERTGAKDLLDPEERLFLLAGSEDLRLLELDERRMEERIVGPGSEEKDGFNSMELTGIEPATS